VFTGRYQATHIPSRDRCIATVLHAKIQYSISRQHAWGGPPNSWMVGGWQQIFTASIVAYRPVARQRPRNKQQDSSRCYEAAGKHASTRIELLLERVLCNPLLERCKSWNTAMVTGVFSMSSVPWSYLEESWGDTAPCGGGVEYLHHNPASRRRRREVSNLRQ
jgi:hypothetical protein